MKKKYKEIEINEQQSYRIIGFVLGLFSKALLEAGGCEVSYKINGEDIMDLERLHQMDISERLKLAIQEERFEDAAKLKKILDAKK